MRSAYQTFQYYVSNAVLIVLILIPLPAIAQLSDNALQQYLVDKAEFTDEDLLRLRQHAVVVKLLKTMDKREIDAFGIVYLNTSPAVSLSAFRQAFDQKQDTTIKISGLFDEPARIENLKLFDLGEKDISSLKECSVGKCDHKLSASMIKAFREEVDWSDPNGSKQATALFRELLTDYIREYQSRGDAALLEYASEKKTIRVADDSREMLQTALLIDEISPGFKKYLTTFRQNRFDDSETVITWSQVNFGLKPFIIINQRVSVIDRSAGLPVYINAYKQLYANHYIDSLLAFSMLVNVVKDDSTASYLVFTVLARSSSLRGLFGSIRRQVAGSESIERTKNILGDARNALDQRPRTTESPNGNDLVETAYPIIPFIIIILLLLGFGLIKYRSHSMSYD